MYDELTHDLRFRSKTIAFAWRRLQEECDRNEEGCENGQLILYWRAYLDGANSQKSEDEANEQQP